MQPPHLHSTPQRLPSTESWPPVLVADAVYLRCRPRRVLDERLWLDRIRYDQVPQLVRALHTACFVVLAYLSVRDPVEADPRTRLRQSSSAHRTVAAHRPEMAKATDFNGVKIP